jgi:hypothetical protein
VGWFSALREQLEGDTVPEIEIYFSGLICHIGPSSHEGSDRTTLVRSVLLDDGAYHVPRIRTSLDPPDSGLGQKLYTGVTFTNLGSGARALNLFIDTVPHLDDLTRSGIEGYPNPAGLVVQLPAGPFTVVDFYDQGAKWTIDEDVYIRPCVPKVTMLSALGSNVSVGFNGGPPVPLKRDGWILITNRETKDKGPNYKPGDDWKKQHTATTGDADDIADWEALPKSTGRTCHKTPSSGRWTVDVLNVIRADAVVDASECTNSHWP